MADEDVKVRLTAEDDTAGATKSASQNISKMADDASASLGTFKERLSAINTERERAMAGLGEQLKDMQMKLASAQVGGDGAGAAQAKQQIITLNQDVVQSQRDSLAEMAKDTKLSDAEYMQVKQAQNQSEKELRDLQVASHKVAEEQKAAATKQAAQQETDAVKQAAEAEKQADQQRQQSLNDVQSGLTRVSAAAAAMSAAMIAAVQGSVQAFADLQQATNSTVATEQAFQGTQGQSTAIAQRLSADGILPLNVSLTATRRLLESGLGIKETETLLNRMKDAASQNRREGTSMTDAMDALGRSFETGQSRLARNAGAIVDYSQALKTGTNELGLHKDTMTVADQAQARYIGFMEQTTGVVGGASRMQASLTGEMEQAKTATTTLAQTLGGALAPAYQVALQGQTGLTSQLTDYIAHHQEGVRSFAAIAIGATTAAAAVGGLAIAFIALVTTINPIVGVIAIVAGLAGAMGGLSLATKANEEAQLQHDEAVAKLGRQYELLHAVMKDGTDEQKKKASEELKTVISDLGDLMPTLVTKWDAEGHAIALNTGQVNANTDAVTENIRIKRQQVTTDAASEEASARDELTAFQANKGSSLSLHAMAKKDMGWQYNLMDPQQQDDIDQQYKDQQGALEAQTEADLLKKVAEAKAKTDRAAKSLGAVSPDEHKRGSYVSPHPTAQQVKDYGTTTGGADRLANEPGAGGNKMSVGLEQDMADLQDLQALDKTPENLKRTLDKVRQIIADHMAELQKLNKDHELLRLRDFTLPKEITAAEYTEATRSLQHDEQMAAAKGAPLDPAVVKGRLLAIKSQFADYLSQHPDAAASIDVRLAGLSPAELKKKVQDALYSIDAAKKLRGDAYTPEMEMAAVQNALVMAGGMEGEEGAKQVDALIGRMHDLEKLIEKAAFDKKFKAIADAKEAAFADKAGLLASLNIALATEESKGALADPKRIAALKQQMLDAVRPALEAQKASLIALDAELAKLEQTKEVVAQREQVERDLHQVQQQLYDEDVKAHKLSLDAKVAAEKAAAKVRTDIQKKALDEFNEAEKQALADFKAGAKAREDAISDEIKAKEAELKLYDRQIAEEDRLKKLAEDKKRIADLEKSGAREDVITRLGPDGKPVYEQRIVGMDAAKKQLADEQLAQDRAHHKEQLQDQIQTLRDQLQLEQESNRQQEQALKDHWAAAKDILTAGFAEMDKAQGIGLDTMKATLVTKLNESLGEWGKWAANVTAIINSIPAPPPPPAGDSGAPADTSPTGDAAPDSTASTTHAGYQAYADGAYVNQPTWGVFGEEGGEYNVPEKYIPRLAAQILGNITPLLAPIMPPGLMRGGGGMGAGGGGVTVQNLTLSLPSVTDAPSFARELPGVLQGAGLFDAFKRGMGIGQASG